MTGVPNRCRQGARELLVRPRSSAAMNKASRRVADYPHLVEQWDWSRNESLRPDSISAGSGQRIWWRCVVDRAHVWRAKVNNRTHGSGCPYCAGNRVPEDLCLIARAPGIASEWHPTKNGQPTAHGVAIGSKRVCWWRCSTRPEHEWRATVRRRVRGHGDCPLCRGRQTNGVRVRSSFTARTSKVPLVPAPPTEAGMRDWIAASRINSLARRLGVVRRNRVHDCSLVVATLLNSAQCPPAAGDRWAAAHATYRALGGADSGVTSFRRQAFKALPVLRRLLAERVRQVGPVACSEHRRLCLRLAERLLSLPADGFSPQDIGQFHQLGQAVGLAVGQRSGAAQAWDGAHLRSPTSIQVAVCASLLAALLAHEASDAAARTRAASLSA